MQTVQNRAFWADILDFLVPAIKVGEPSNKEKVAMLSWAAVLEQRSSIHPAIMHVLPFDEIHNDRWAKMREFFEHPDVKTWGADSVVQQLTLVASGERGVSLSDIACAHLPLND